MNKYYICFELHQSEPKHEYKKGWVIKETENDLDTTDGLLNEIKFLENKKGGQIWIINWKRLDA